MKTKPFLITTIVLALISLISSIQLTLEKIELWKNPNYITSCSWNPVFSCKGPMNSWQSTVFVLPNPIIGIAGFSLVILIAFTALFVKLPKWYWMLYLTGITLATTLVGWLITQTLYDINALCIYCMIVWACVIPLFWLTLSYVIKEFFPKSWARFLPPLKYVLILFSYGVVIVMIYAQFRPFFDNLLFS